MPPQTHPDIIPSSSAVPALGELPTFKPGEVVRVMNRAPIGHYRVPHYLRGRVGVVQQVIKPVQLDNEREGYGLNAGSKRHYYRAAFKLKDLWPNYQGPAHDNLRIEVFEDWLERI